MTRKAQVEHISSAPARESGRYRSLAAALCGAPNWQGLPNVRLPIPIAAFKAHGRLGQPSARSRLYVEGQKASRWVELAGRLVPLKGFLEGTVKLPHRRLHLTAGTAALLPASRFGRADVSNHRSPAAW